MKENNTPKNVWFTFCANALYPAQAIQWGKCNLIRLSTYFTFDDFPECFRGPLKTMW